jgi:NADH-quinone oxidoreductase subunit E
MNNLKVLLSDDVKKVIDHWLKKYPPEQRQSALLPALRFTQEANGGSLTNELVEAVAEYLQVPAIAAFEVVTFYSMYHLKPVGKYQINVCTSISCKLSHSKSVMEHLKKRLKIEVGDTTPDGKFSLFAAPCLAACVNAPAMLINKDYYDNVTSQKVDAILDGLE